MHVYGCMWLFMSVCEFVCVSMGVRECGVCMGCECVGGVVCAHVYWCLVGVYE